MIRSATARALAAASALFAAGPALADGLVDNVNGITFDQKGSLVRFEALVIGRDGRVVRLLTHRDKRPDKPDFRTDGGGRTMLPGFIDSHGHVIALGFAQMTLDLSAAKSLAEAQKMIADYAIANPQKSWIIGRGWNQEAWGLGRFPTAAEIDAVVADRPVWLERVDGHAGWANSAAMKAAGITAKTTAPAGGRIERTATGPSGIFIDAATNLVARHLPRPLPRERDQALAKAQELLLSYGVTGMADMGTSLDDWQSFRRAGDGGWLRMRIFAYAGGVDAMVQIAGPGPSPWLYDDRLKLVGVKLFADGALGSRGAWLKAAYADNPGTSGLSLLSDTQMGNLMVRAAMDRFQIAVHAIGDRANQQVLDAIDQIVSTFSDDRRWRIEHAQIVDPADLPRFGRNGIIASMQPVHQTSDRTMAEARLGPARLTGAYAWKSMLKAGAHLAFGTDAPVESPDPFAGLAAAIAREDAQGNPPGGWQPQERLTREEALAAYTLGGAYAVYGEGKFGTLMPGAHADFILIDSDPMLASPSDLRAMKVQQTWINGRPVFRRDAPASGPGR